MTEKPIKSGKRGLALTFHLGLHEYLLMGGWSKGLSPMSRYSGTFRDCDDLGHSVSLSQWISKLMLAAPETPNWHVHRVQELVSTSGPSSSPLSEELGGIDMNQIDVDRQGSGVNIQFNPVEIQEIIDMGITGFAPVIISITPLPSILPLLGLAPRDEEDFELTSIN